MAYLMNGGASLVIRVRYIACCATYAIINYNGVGDVEVYAGEIQQSLASIRAALPTEVEAGAIPVVLGGDHSITASLSTAS